MEKETLVKIKKNIDNINEVDRIIKSLKVDRYNHICRLEENVKKLFNISKIEAFITINDDKVTVNYKSQAIKNN